LTKKELTKKLKGIKIQIVSNDKSLTNDKDKGKGKKKATKKKEEESEDEEYEETSSSSEDDSESSDEESNVEDEYLDWVPKSVKKNPRQLHKVKGLIMDIEEKTVSVEKLLSCKIRKKYKSEIFEWIMIYENSMPLSEERKALRKQIYDMIEMYKKEYSDYKLHKKEIKDFEKRSKDFNEMHDIQYKILRLDTKEENKEAIYRKYLELMDKSEDENEEFFKLKSWIQMALQLPFDKIKEFPSYCSVSHYLKQVKQIFDQELYGMDKVKEQLLLFIHGKLVNPDIKGCCLGLVGPPGVGKTSIARCLARVMDFPFEQITFGGVNSAEFIRGFDYTYVGSRPGEIVRCLSRMKYKNGILFFDEYEKISQNKDITACLLHITDFTQNNTFRDNYLHDLTIDLSSLWFVYSMNALPEDEALKDRIFVINVDGYKEEEKVRILCDYLLPKHLKNLNLQETDIIIDDEMAKYFIRKVSPQDKGIRTMEKYLKDILSKTSFLVTNQDSLHCSFSLPKKYYPLQFPVTLNENMMDIFLKDAMPKTLNLSFYI
jgi:ATP-dependent Lon protease